MMRRRQLSLLVVALGGASAMIWSLLKNPDQDPQRTQVNLEESRRTLAAIPVQAQEEISFESKTTLAVSHESGSLPRPEVIEKFKMIHAKVFKSDEDQKILQRMIMDSKYILQLGEYLHDRQSLQKEEFKTNQNAVIDLLLEALKNGDSQSSQQAILDVIKDTQVEDEKLSLDLRELIGGVKAELLYQGTAIKPELARPFAEALPGPVSQKIWQNVQQQQVDNLALSEEELQNRQVHKRQ